jgi:hypothetical protein
MTDIYKITIKKSQVINDLKNFKDFKETKQNFTIINHPLGHFEKGSIKKVKIEEGYIYFGNLKPQFKSLQGSGILSRFLTKAKDKVVDVFSPRLNDYNNNAKRMMAKYGHEQIKSMAIYRTPLPSMLNKVINVVSLGQWEELKKKYGFDKFYHLALVLTLKNNKNIIVEKNEVISVSDSYKTNSDTEVLPIDNYTLPITLNELLDKARKSFGNDMKYFGYDPFDNNCQVFIKYILMSNGLYTIKINNFLFQDISELTKELNPLTKGIMRGTTKVAAIVNKVLGKGKKRKIEFVKVEKGYKGMKGKGKLDANHNYYIFDNRGESNIVDLKYSDNDFNGVKVFNNVEELDSLIGNKWKRYDTYLLKDESLLNRERKIISIITDKNNNYISHAYTEDRGNTLLIGYVYTDEKYRKSGYCVPLLHLLFEYLKNINLLDKFNGIQLIYTAENITALICYAKVCSYYGYFDRRLKEFNAIGWDTKFDEEQLEELTDIGEKTSPFIFNKKK